MMEFMTAISGVASGWAAYFKGLLSQYGIALPQALMVPLILKQEHLLIYCLFLSWSW